MTKAGAPTLTLLAEPKKLETPVKVGAEMKRFGGILSVGIRDDGTIIAGLAGGNIDAAPQSLAINAVATGGMLAGSGKPATDDCPYARCFAFTLEQAKQFAKMGTIQFGLAADPTVTSGFGFVNAPVVTGLRLKPIVEGL